MVPLRRARGVLRHEKSPDEMDLEEVSLPARTCCLCPEARNLINPVMQLKKKQNNPPGG